MAFSRIIRLICAFAALLLACTQSVAQGYFVDRTDVKLEYVRKSASDGKFVWRQVLSVIGITDAGTYTKYTIKADFYKQNGKPLFKGNVKETAIVEKHTGDVKLDVGSAMASYIKARIGIDATASSVPAELPAAVEPGDTLPPVMAQAKVGPLTYKVVINDRKVLRREKVTVPAGTFDCIVVSEHRLETGPGHNRDVTNLTWYSKGVGYVRHDTYQKGVLDTSEILQRII